MAQEWEYITITVSKNSVKLKRPDGGEIVIPDEPISETLNKLGKEGWELVQGGPTKDATGSTYIMKRPVEPPKEKGKFEAEWM